MWWRRCGDRRLEEMTATISSPRISAQRLLEFVTTLSSDSDNVTLFIEKYCPSESSSVPTLETQSDQPTLPLCTPTQLSSLSCQVHHNILQVISKELLLINEFYDRPPETTNSQANLLSISHLRGIYTGLEILWSWGVFPYLTLTNDLLKESVPKSVLIQSKLILEVSERLKSTLNSTITVPNIEIIVLIFRTCTCHMFRGMMIERNFKRVLCACISILCHCTPQTLPNLDPTSLQKSRLACQNLLNQVIMDPLVSPENTPLPNLTEQNVDIDRCTTIESLRYVSMCGTSVMQQIVGSLLTMILIQPDGLRATLSVYLSG
jgi:hypothetical protein